MFKAWLMPGVDISDFPCGELTDGTRIDLWGEAFYWRHEQSERSDAFIRRARCELRSLVRSCVSIESITAERKRKSLNFTKYRSFALRVRLAMHRRTFIFGKLKLDLFRDFSLAISVKPEQNHPNCRRICWLDYHFHIVDSKVFKCMKNKKNRFS